MITIITVILNLIGLAAVGGFIYVFFGVQKKTLATKQYTFFGYTLTVESTAKKQLKIEIKK